MTVISERKQKRLIHSFSDQFPVTQKTGIFAQCGRAFDTLSGGKQHIADMMRMVYEQRWQQWKTLELEEESQLAGIWVCHLSSKYYKMTSFYLFFGKLFKRYNHQCDFHSWKVREKYNTSFPDLKSLTQTPALPNQWLIDWPEASSGFYCIWQVID